MHRFWRILLVLIVFGAVLGAATVSFTDDTVSFKTNFFTDSGGLLVRSPAFQLMKDLARNTAFTLQYTLDRVSIPPYRGISAKPLIDGVTGASKPAADSANTGTYVKNRNEFLATVNTTRWGLTGYYSVENDYTGRLISASFNQDFNQKNTNLAFSLGYGYDSISPIGMNANYSRSNILADVTLTQTLSPVTIIRVGVDASKLSGFQNNPYRTVYVAGLPRLERHPTERLRLAGYAKLNTYLRPARASVWMDYRFYGDDWGIFSHTMGLKFHQTISRRLMMRYRYRFYTQTAANFYRRNYPLLTRFYTEDYKLEPFNSHLFGFMISYALEPLADKMPLFAQSTLDLKYERFFTSNNFTANIYQFGLTLHY
jgi:hypothetical protein